MRTRMSAIIVAALLVLTGVAFAQETTGTLTGKLVDPQGLAVPGATVTVSGPQGSKSFVSDADGHFQASFLTPGNYDVRAELQGFKTVDVKGVAVRLGQTTDLSLKMEVGGLTETVQVVSSAAVVDTTSTTTGAVLSSDMFERIPVGRRMTDTLYLAPGVSGTTVGRANPSMSGASGLDNLYVVDGVNVTNTGYGAVGSYSIIFGSLGTATPFDFVKEVQVKTGGYEAEFGQALGGVVNVVTKSGIEHAARIAVRLQQAVGARGRIQDDADGERHGQHRRRSRKATSASRPADASCATSCSSSAPSTRRGRRARSTRPTASRCRASAKSIANGARCRTRRRARGRRRRDIASMRRSSAIRRRARWDHSAPRRCW